MKSTHILAAALLAFAAGSFAQTAPASATHAAGAAASAMTAGEVRKIDNAAGKITIRHEELKNLEMPAMTMVFRAADPKLLDQVKEGDKVNFVAERVNGELTVTQIQAAR